MPLFTKQNAAELGRKGGLASAQRERERKLQAEADRIKLLTAPVEPEETPTRNRVLEQIKLCDDMLKDCKKPDTFAKLTAAKERLWNLVFPKAGVLRPRSRSRPERPIVTLSPPDLPQPVVSCGVKPPPNRPPTPQAPV